MSFGLILLVAFGLAMDCFAVSLGVGTNHPVKTTRFIFRLIFHFGLFQGLMTFLGWLGGTTLERYIANYDHWVVLILLAWVGIRMIREGFNKEEKEERIDPSRGATLVVLSVATSLDALAVGISMAMLQTNILAASLTIGIISLLVSLAGLLGGHLLGVRFGKKMEIIGGLILIGIGLRVVIEHLMV